ncbi:hypothetical protein [Rhodovibrio sodomensis]|nr:hypothetical protein [Rhodovibrio sodomensis]
MAEQKQSEVVIEEQPAEHRLPEGAAVMDENVWLQLRRQLLNNPSMLVGFALVPAVLDLFVFGGWLSVCLWGAAVVGLPAWWLIRRGRLK